MPKPKAFFYMNKNIKTTLIITSILLILFLIIHFTHYYIPCIFHEITGLYCPGCGITRMFLALLKGNIYAAFRYNMLVFCSLPLIIFFCIEYIYSKYKNKIPLYKKIPNYIWALIIVILIIWMIIRNIFPFFAPTKIL